MKKEHIKGLIQILTPLALLLIFTLVICLPDALPFTSTKPKNSVGLGTVSRTVAGMGKDKISFSMKKVPSGTAPLGCTDIPGALVVAHPFLLAETEVTRGLWLPVLTRAVAADYGFYDTAGIKGLQYEQGDAHPVTDVSWRDAVVWCNALSAELKLTAVYYGDAAFTAPIRSVKTLADSRDALFVNPDADGIRLPTSAEWELAARYIDGKTWTSGGNASGCAFHYFYQSQSADYAVFFADAPARVKSCASNALGLFDMSGNVWEWCFDLAPAKADLPGVAAGPDNELKRIVRGGSWVGNAYRLQIGGEFGTLPDAHEIGQGFRIAQNGN